MYMDMCMYIWTCACRYYIVCCVCTCRVANILLKQLASITPWLVIAQAVTAMYVSVRQAIFHQTAVNVTQPISTYLTANVSHSYTIIINWPHYYVLIAFCRDNCRLFRPDNLGGCQTCRAGFTGAPECCQCEPGKTEVDGQCSKCRIVPRIQT